MDKRNEPFWEKSYGSHHEHDKKPDTIKAETWKRLDTVDAWRHKRMYDNMLPLIKNYPGARWLTIGDGRYGTDANYLLRNDIKEVLATSISDVLLKQSKQDGFISEYKIENAEKLSFDDESFDFAFCKEAYHHFPRPMIALYEMLRVAKIGIVIIEPNDRNVKKVESPMVLVKPGGRWQLMKNFVKDIFGIKRCDYTSYTYPVYESVGNYVYTVSSREFEKVALALNYPVAAFKGMNDYYEEGVEFETANDSSEVFHRIKSGIEQADKACANQSSDYNLLVSIIFKVMPGEKTITELSAIGFDIKKLGTNPYL